MIWRKLFYTFVLVGLLALLFTACGTANPVDLENIQEVEPGSSGPVTDDSESDNSAETEQEIENPTSIPPTVPPPPTIQVDETAVEYDGDVQVGFTDDGHAFRGDPAAPIVIEEFSDFQCPFCTRFSEQTLSVLDKNQIATGDVLLIYHDFPLESIHPQAFAAANAARCAGDQGAVAYWDMHDLLYGRTQQWSVPNPNPVFTQFAHTFET